MIKNGQRYEELLWTRRRMLKSSGAALLVTATAVSCDSSTDPEPSDDTNGDVSTDKEAPTLADQVEAGSLPPLDERLPETPLVVEPVERLGVYGGEWRTSLLGPSDRNWLRRTIAHEYLTRWDVDFTEPRPNIAESIDTADGGRVYTFHLRPGMRWSDGTPFTADDFIFFYEDELLDEEMVFRSVPTWMMAGGEPAGVEKLDDYTLQVSFAAPNGVFLHKLATVNGDDFIGHPRHYLEQFHPKYNPDAEQLAKDEGFADWAEMLGIKSSEWDNPERPTVNPWVTTDPLGEGQQLVAERNPYYWKVDPEGRQLPYLDQVTFAIIGDVETTVISASNGEIDMHVRNINTLQNKPVLAENRESGEYDFFDTISANMNQMVIMLNLTHQNESMRQVFNNVDFRIGLSHAIDRQELVDVVFQRQGEPWQCAPRRESELFDEEMAKQYTEFDLAEANRRLDQAGFVDRDADGFRLGPDGDPIQFTVDVATDSPALANALERVRESWREVGVDMRPDPVDRSLLNQRTHGNELEASVWWGSSGSTWGAILDPWPYFPFRPAARWAVPWVNWFTGASEPVEEPPEPAKQQMELYRSLIETIDREEQLTTLRQILQIAKEEFYVIGTVLPAGTYGIKKNNFRNVPVPMHDALQYPTPGPTNPEQYFIEA